MNRVDVGAGVLRAVVSLEDPSGWCGFENVQHQRFRGDWLLSPAFTLEHYIGVPLSAADYIEYEPCVSPKRLQPVDGSRCVLYYAPLACSQVECTLHYQMTAPHYFDVVAQVRTQRAEWPLGFLALFFATIVKAPTYSGINFIGEDLNTPVKGDNRWLHFNGYASHNGRTVHPSGLQRPELVRPDNSPQTYYYDDSSARFDAPFFYAHVQNMGFATVFRPQDKERVRFVVNPLAPAFGGPAWDFFWIIDRPTPGQTYTLTFRGVFKPFVSATDMLREYEGFVQHHP